MINFPMNTSEPLNKHTVLSINQQFIQVSHNTQNIHSINSGKTLPSTNTNTSQPTTTSAYGTGTSSESNSNQTIFNNHIANKPCPPLLKPIQKGQKTPLENGTKLNAIRVCIGWNVTNHECDADLSAFLLDNTGKVIGDAWFVFYGQKASPDGSTLFSIDNSDDREVISIDFNKINPNVSKIVFVLTINEALEKHFNFSMLKDVYIRIMNSASSNELVSFKVNDYYSNIISMMIGEIYMYNGLWKFNAIGNGVAKDLAGLCELYGVQTI